MRKEEEDGEITSKYELYLLRRHHQHAPRRLARRGDERGAPRRRVDAHDGGRGAVLPVARLRVAARVEQEVGHLVVCCVLQQGEEK